MAAVHDIQGYTIVLDKIVHITRIFEAPNDEGTQFNVRLTAGRLELKFPNRAEATLQRELLIKAIKQN